MQTRPLLLALGLALLVVPAFAQRDADYLTAPVSQLDATLDGLDLIYLLVDLNLNQEQLSRVQQMVASYQQQRQEADKRFADELADIQATLVAIRDTLLTGGWPKGNQIQAFNRVLTSGQRGGRPRGWRGGPAGDPADGMMRQFRQLLTPQQRELVEWEMPDPRDMGPQSQQPDQNLQQLQDTLIRVVAQAADAVRYSNRNAYIARRRTEAQSVLATLGIEESDPTYAQRFQQLQDLFADVRRIPEEEYNTPDTRDFIASRAMRLFGDALPGGGASGPIVAEAELRALLTGQAAPLAISQRLGFLTASADLGPVQ